MSVEMLNVNVLMRPLNSTTSFGIFINVTGERPNRV